MFLYKRYEICILLDCLTFMAKTRRRAPALVVTRSSSFSFLPSSSPAPTPTPTTSGKRSHDSSVRSTVEDESTDIEIITPTRKRSKGMSMHEKAQQFREMFPGHASDEQILSTLLRVLCRPCFTDHSPAKQMKGWSSKFYSHYTLPPIINKSDPLIIKYEFHCKK